jgi:hypothetical protein
MNLPLLLFQLSLCFLLVCFYPISDITTKFSYNMGLSKLLGSFCLPWIYKAFKYNKMGEKSYKKFSGLSKEWISSYHIQNNAFSLVEYELIFICFIIFWILFKYPFTVELYWDTHCLCICSIWNSFLIFKEQTYKAHAKFFILEENFLFVDYKFLNVTVCD